MDSPTPNHWFPAKRYGWGWGPPRVSVLPCAILMAICWTKGERPRWRWRGRDL